MDAFIGEIRAFCFDYAPIGWIDCDGTVYQISQYQALAALLGNRFGGDGRNTFGVPDLRVRIPFGYGVSDAGTVFDMGRSIGALQCQLSAVNIPSHTHAATFTATNATPLSVNIAVVDGAANAPGPANNYLAQSQEGNNTYALPSAGGSASLGGISATFAGAGTVAVSPAGSVTPRPITTQPSFVATRFCICVEGEFPTRP